MILNSKQVKSLLTNTDFGAEAQHGFDCSIAKIAMMQAGMVAVSGSTDASNGASVIGGAVLVDKTHPTDLTYLEPVEQTVQRMGKMAVGPDWEKVPPVDIATRKGWALQKGAYSVTFNEGGKIPVEHCGWFVPRSSIIRCGNDLRSGLYDAGFEAENFGAILIVRVPMFIEVNARIAQFIISTAVSSELYDGQWQGEKDHK